MVQQLNKINEADKSLLAEVADFPLVGPYMVAFFLAAHIEVLQLFFLPVVVLSYVAYFAFLLGAILEKDKDVRVGCCILLSAWFVLTLFGFSEWAMYWSV